MMRRFLAILVISAFAVILPHIAFGVSSAQVYQIAAQVTVLIDGYQSGSGVIFKRNGNVYYLLTAKHVVNENAIYYVITLDGDRHRIESTNIQIVNNIDLAVVQFTSDKTYQVAQLINADQVANGSTVYVAGAPAPSATIPQRTLIVSPGTLVGVQQPQDGYALIYNNITQPGMSGGPLLNEEGQVIGIHGQADQRNGIKSGLNLAIPINSFLVPTLGIVITLQSPPVVPSQQTAVTSPSPIKPPTEEQKRKAAELKNEAIEMVKNANTKNEKIDNQNWWQQLWNGFWNLLWFALKVICGVILIVCFITILISGNR